MQNLISKIFAMLLLFVGGNMAAFADDFDPVNPAEPYVCSKLTVTADPVVAVSSLSGAGHYREGTVVTLRSSRRSTLWTFSHWEKNGEWFSDEASPKYTMEADAVTFTACYDYTPASPDEPWIDDNRLYLVADPLSACTFNQESGISYEYDETVTVQAKPNGAYTFKGWFDGGTLVNSSLKFSFNMPDRDRTLVARFEYDPVNPAEPDSDGSQTDVQTNLTGDANKDGLVNVSDVVFLVNVCLSRIQDYNHEICDVNNDGLVNVSDVVWTVRKCLGK